MTAVTRSRAATARAAIALALRKEELEAFAGGVSDNDIGYVWLPLWLTL